jgi:polar amino acid transport system substrate-binding protein
MKANLRNIIAVGMLLAVNAYSQSVVSFRADSYMPYCGDPADSKPGFAVEILKAVFEKDGVKVDYATMPWKRAVGEAEKGVINGVIGAYKSDTPDFIFPEESLGLAQNTFFLKKGSTWKFETVASLKGKRLGVISGYSYGETLDNYVKQNKANTQLVDESTGDNGLDQAVRKLQAGRIDVFVEGKVVFWAQVNKLGVSKDDFIEAGVANEAEPIYVSFSPKKDDAKALAAKFTAGVAELRKSGELAKILAKYGVQDWAK